MPDESLLGKRLNEYTLESVIGSGPYSTVYCGHRDGDPRTLAIKVFPRDLAQDRFFAPRFKREVRELARLQHETVLPVIAAGQGDGHPFVVMPYLAGGSLAGKLAETPTLPVEEAARIVTRVAAALDAAHDKGVLHRGVKPSNILFDEDGDAYLADFNLATVRAALAEQTGISVAGSSGYTAPELVRGGSEVTRALDVYGLGVTLFQMLAGRLPYVGSSPVHQLMLHVSEPVPSVREFNAGITPAVDAVVRRALAKDPRERFERAGDLADAFATAAGVAEEPEDTAVLAGKENGERADEEAAAPPDEGERREMRREMPVRALAPPSTPPPVTPPPTPPPGTGGAGRRRGLPSLTRGRPWYAVAAALVMLVAAWFFIGLLIGAIGQQELERVRLASLGNTQTPIAETAMAHATGTQGARLAIIERATQRADNMAATATALAPTATPTPTHTPVPSPTVTPTPYSGGGGLLAYVTERDGDPEIRLLDPLTGEDKRVTENDVLDGAPAWSPDGRYLAFHSEATEVGRHIFVVDARCFDTEEGCVGKARELTTANRIDSYPAWSPDGRRIAFAWSTGESWGFTSVNLDGLETALMSVPAPMRLFAWTPDDELIFFGLNPRGTSEMQRLTIGAESHERMPFTSSGGSIEFISYSDDFKTVVYSALIGRYRHLFLADATCPYVDDCVIRRLTEDAYSYITPDISADGSLIVTATNRSGDYQLVVVDTQGAIIRRITEGSGQSEQPVWQPARP